MPPKRIILKSSSSSSAESINQRQTRDTAGSRSVRKVTRGKTGLPSSPSKRTGKTPLRTMSLKELESDLVLSSPSDTEDEQEEEEEEEEKGEEERGGEDLELSSISDGGISDEEDVASGSVHMDDELSDSEGTISQAPSETQPSRLTARQRALLQAEEMSLESSPSLDTLSLPRALTEEELLKKSEKSRRRKTQRDQKLEQSKAETIQRLLQKQGVRSKKMRTQTLDHSASIGPLKNDPFERIDDYSLRFISNKTRTMVILGPKVPEIAQNPMVRWEREQCSIDGCGNTRRYLHAAQNLPVCSLNCYRILDCNKS